MSFSHGIKSFFKSGLIGFSAVCSTSFVFADNQAENISTWNNIKNGVSKYRTKVSDWWHDIGHSETSLLPDALRPDSALPPRTVVLDFDVIAYSDWSRDHGWLIYPRPGACVLIARLQKLGYEIVIWTPQYQQMGDVMVEQAVNTVLTSRFAGVTGTSAFPLRKLFKEHLSHKGGYWVKDISRLNRDMSRVIAIDWDAGNVSKAENTIVIPKYDGDFQNDDQLFRHVALLESFQRDDVADVRETLRALKQINPDCPTAFYEHTQKNKSSESSSKRKIKIPLI